MASELTPWFVCGELPARRGVYNVSCRCEDQSGEWYSYWDGQTFRWFDHDPQQAFADRADIGSGMRVLRNGSWRGLVVNPRKGASHG